MENYNKNIGEYGELLAVEYLIKNNHRILEKNFRNRYGEIDIISSFNDIIIFTEVKSRYTNTFGLPMESVTYSKQNQIIKLSSFYISKKSFYNFNIRYDVIEVLFNKLNQSFYINHLEDAFRLY